MLTLYFKPSCPFCQKVVSVIEGKALKITLKDVSDDESARAELIMKGGKKQVPFLIDSETGVSMYESDAIIEYIQSTYPSEQSSAPTIIHVHRGGDVCPS